MLEFLNLLISPKYGDFTLELNNSILASSALFIIVFGSISIANIRNNGIIINKYRKNWVYLSRLILIASIFICHGKLLLDMLSSQPYGSLPSLSNIAVSAGFLISFVLSFYDFQLSDVTSGVLLFFWFWTSFINFFLLLHCGIRAHYTNTHIYGIDNICSTYSVLLVLSIANLLIHWLPNKYLLPYFQLERDNKLLHTSKVDNPYNHADIFSKISFSWMTKLMRLGYEKYLDEDDLYELPSEFKSENVSARISKIFAKYPNRLAFTIFSTFKKEIIISGIFKLIFDILSFTQPQILKNLINFVSNYNKFHDIDPEKFPIIKGCMLTLYMFLVGFIQTCILHQYFFLNFNSGMNCRSGLTSIIYKKALRLGSENNELGSTGDIVNLMSVDVQRLQDLFQWGQIIWSGPTQLFLALFELYQLLGKSMFVGVAIIMVMVPINSTIIRYQKSLQKKQMGYKDSRTKLISEILNAIKSIKLYCWEPFFKAKLDHIRNDKELKNLKTMGIVQAYTSFQFNIVPFLVSSATFIVFVLFNKDTPLSTEIVFPALALFNLLQFPLAIIPMVITAFVEASVSVERLTKFLNNDELQVDSVKKLTYPENAVKDDVLVELKNCTFLWQKKPEYKIALSNIDFVGKKGNLHCIVSKIGNGKSAMMKAILGDIIRIEGDAFIKGSVAYCSQNPWIINASIRDNVVFGKKFDAEFYDKTIKACSLDRDLDIFSEGDMTVVGEKGLQLSGGMKARVALARAVYSRSDVYLLDDPLSAVDEHVAKHLLRHVLGPHGLLKTKCRILATNKITSLNISDSVTLLENGKIAESGHFDDLIKLGDSSKLGKLINEFGKKNSTDEDVNQKEVEDFIDKKSSNDSSSLSSKNSDELVRFENSLENKSLRRASDATLRSIGFFEGHDGTGNEESKEKREVGKVRWDIYLEYAKACNPKFVLVCIVCIILSMLLSVFGNVWLKYWSEKNTEAGYNPDFKFYSFVYLGFGVGSAFATLISVVILWVFCTIKGSQKLHDNMITTILKAPMSFFETTHTGRILNRFTNDIYKIDEMLGRTFMQFFNNVIKVTFTIIVISFTTWQFVFLIGPLMIVYSYYQQYYMRSSRELRRLDSTTRSPIYSHFQESLGGLSTIRAYNHATRFIHLNQCKVDNNMCAYYPSVNANRWLACRIESLSSLIIFATGSLCMYRLNSGKLTAGAIGLALSYCLQITQSLNWIVRMTVEVETNIVSVERVKEYSELTEEAPFYIQDTRPANDWPSTKGGIEFNDFCMRYREGLPLALKHINLSIKAGEKIGIVGRTGCGKSSLISSLFRLVEAASGEIVIDGVDISKIGLHDLRSKISIIPQDSQIFKGTVRDNIDPTRQFSNDEIWKALELSHLKEYVINDLGGNLESEISEGGSNLSSGYAQLLNLARALLISTKTSILVLDEATAQVDVETDKIIQETIKTAFQDKIIISIAHRIHTILSFDKIIALDAGEVIEFDTPTNLIAKKEGIFYSLCKEAGLAE
ncbi:related to Metal resistance protein YCF1 [Hanseniaspora guilliermondii]|uniref:Related to Metal resistance protein YCF1 n=1 Tax=Hanseniaspora guilliermondii TaxID=56406 RepID=A0A1L0FKS9_9ASCO|nr:related to Metal resistance protein YCF1 [Hanseniaspora guilliermondii]